MVYDSQSRAASLKLRLDDENHILSPFGDIIMIEQEGESVPLTFNDDILQASPATILTYGCNLPTPVMSHAQLDANYGLLNESGSTPQTIDEILLSEFMFRSFSGGQIAFCGYDGTRWMARMRWLCQSSAYPIGSLWRSYIQLVAYDEASLWTALDLDYFFDTTNMLSIESQPVPIKTEMYPQQSLQLIHPEQFLTQFPCSSGLVKVTEASADGWLQRSLDEIRFYPDGNLIAYFSDANRMSLNPLPVETFAYYKSMT